MISAKFGHILDKPLTSLVRGININPNILTITGFLVTILAALVIPFHMRLGALLIFVGGCFDILDGAVARTQGRATDFGAFLDSVLDRISDAALFLAISWHFHVAGNTTIAVISVMSMIGALMISYTRARAEGIGKKCSAGLMERTERIVLLTIACLTGFLAPILWIMLVLTWITVIQRIHFVWNITR